MRLVYITVPNRDEALGLARGLVESRLAACANVLPGITSVYRWEGQVCEDAEVLLIAKTAPDKVGALTTWVREKHSYDVPCIVSLPIEAGNPDYLQWLAEQVQGPAGSRD